MIWKDWKFLTKLEKVLRISYMLSALCGLVVMMLYLALDFPKGSNVAGILIYVSWVLSGIEDWVYRYERKWAVFKFITGSIMIAGYTYAAIVR